MKRCPESEFADLGVSFHAGAEHYVPTQETRAATLLKAWDAKPDMSDDGRFTEPLIHNDGTIEYLEGQEPPGRLEHYRRDRRNPNLFRPDFPFRKDMVCCFVFNSDGHIELRIISLPEM